MVDCHDTAAGNPPQTLLNIPTIRAGPAAVGDIDRSAGVALLADGAMPHREPAVVDAFDGSAALAGDHAEMADGFAGRHDQARDPTASTRPPGRMLLTATSGASTIDS